MKKIYFDYAATTPIDPRIKIPKVFGNTMSLHSFGREAKLVLENCRKTIASLINAQLEEIIFTSSATESNNLALKGMALADKSRGNHIIISSIEHPCIIESAKWLGKQGFKVTKLPVNRLGLINPKDVEKAITNKTILVSIMHASNEIGTIEPIAEIGKICRQRGVYFHTDATQTFGKLPINVNKLNIDLLTASSHKMYGPKGVALLYVRKGVKIEPILYGGGQENGLRSSTVNVSGIAGFAAACELCKKEMKQEQKRLTALRNKLIKGVLKIKGSYLNGDHKNRLANNANFRFDFIEGESLVMRLDMEGIACSTGSACSSIKLEPSHVLLAIGLRPEQAHGSLRVSLGRPTKESDINYFLKILPGIVKQLRAISPYGK